EVIGLYDRWLEGVAGAQPHISPTVGSLLPGGNRHTGLGLELALHTLLVASRREGELQIRIFHTRVRAPEAVDEGGVEREYTLARRQIAHDLAHELEPTSALVDGLGVLDTGDEARSVVIAQILTHTRKCMAQRDAARSQKPLRSDAGELQQLGRIKA